MVLEIRRSGVLFVLAMFLMVAFNPLPVAAQALSTYNINAGHVYVAGISSGGAMATQMHVAFSKVFKGTAIYAGIPYDCAGPDPLSSCASNSPPINLSAIESTTSSWASQGLIDATSNLSAQPVYLWSGIYDNVVYPAVMNNVQGFYQHFGSSVFQYDNTFPAEHGWESPDGDVACGVLYSPFMIACYQGSSLYDSEKKWLTKWFGTLNARNNGSLRGTLSSFNQNLYVPGGIAINLSMDNYGYVFVPQSCASGTSCGLVVALHGCSQSASQVGFSYVDLAGINEWADTNNIVVLYPQAYPTSVNPYGCWNWYGYLGDSNYAQKSGLQMQALFNMVKQIGGSAIPSGG